ncbi:GAF domain-containing protein [Streptomyces nigrescens]
MVIGLKMPGWLYTTITALGALAVLAAVVLADRRVTTARQAAAAATRNQRKAFEDVLVPIVNLLGDIVSSDRTQRPALKQQMKLSIVTLIAQLVGPADTRACFLEEVPNTVPGQREIKCQNHLWSGRGEPPVTTFREQDVRGKELLKLLDEGADIFVPDVDQLHASLRPDSHTYKTYISTAVKVGDASLGVLTVDCLRPGDLTKDDTKLVAVFARLLGAALAVKR